MTLLTGDEVEKEMITDVAAAVLYVVERRDIPTFFVTYSVDFTKKKTGIPGSYLF